MKNTHAWFARVGVVLFLLMLFIPSASISGGTRGLGLFVAAALCVLYVWNEQVLFRKGTERSWADLLPKVTVPGLVVILTPVFAVIR